MPSLFLNANPQLAGLKNYAMVKFKIPEDQVDRIALLAAFDATLAEAIAEAIAEENGRKVSGDIEDGKFKNAAT